MAGFVSEQPGLVRAISGYIGTIIRNNPFLYGRSVMAKKRHAGNLMKHLQSHHYETFKAVKEEEERRRGAGALTTAEPEAKRQCKWPDGVQMTAKVLQLHCVRLVSENCLALRFLDYEAFQDIIRPMINAMPLHERFTVSSRNAPEKIAEFAELVRQYMIKEAEGKMVSLKVDGASKDHRHFLGVNTQFCVKGKSVVRTLGIEELHGESSAQKLKSHITIMLHRFKIEPKQVVSFTSDSGANYNLAGKLLAEHAQEQEVEDPDDDFNIEEGGAWAHADVELHQDDFKMQSVRCAAHTLQLAIEDAMKADSSHQNIVKKVRNLAKYLLQDTKA
ncbi:hypothetical protein KUF71_014218 [Frankliniella fusca]|uniref:Zinc finger BED domain-containing protein 4-like n=1 Tax=Frankliniella fusca TaxID=407009 RepID=A0AAE1LPB8_9NEOP|nr:hypothetical protein KUF71_014218 [Frankliniella fusca]